MMAYKGNAYVLGRSSETSNLYSMEDGKFCIPKRAEPGACNEGYVD